MRKRLLRAVGVIAAACIFHLVVTGFVVSTTFAYGMRRFDTGGDAGAAEIVGRAAWFALTPISSLFDVNAWPLDNAIWVALIVGVVVLVSRARRRREPDRAPA